MIDKQCSLCNQYYTDKEGHNYDQCVLKCRDNWFSLCQRSEALTRAIVEAQGALYKALEIQKQDWWKR